VDITVCRAVDRGENVRLDYSRNPDFVDAGYFNRQFPEIIKKWYIDRGVILRANGSSISPFERLMKINPQVIEWFRERGIDLQTEPVEVRHAAQHFQGGVLINTRAETSVPGLYACGEAAGGQHGANRPGGNALLDCQVMGHIAGIQAAQWASGVCDTSIGQSADRLIESLEKEFGKENGFEPNEALRIVREFLSSRLGVIRTPGGLNDAINSLKDAFDTGVKKGEASRVDAVSARSAQVIGLALARAASMRRESRGAHLYFPNPDDVKPKLRKEPGGRVWNAIFDIKGEPKVKILKIPGLAK
jgi:succinate dehydrogenase / fumarate reductase flavoprotein subunit